MKRNERVHEEIAIADYNVEDSEGEHDNEEEESDAYARFATRLEALFEKLSISGSTTFARIFAFFFMLPFAVVSYFMMSKVYLLYYIIAGISIVPFACFADYFGKITYSRQNQPMVELCCNTMILCSFVATSVLVVYEYKHYIQFEDMTYDWLDDFNQVVLE